MRYLIFLLLFFNYLLANLSIFNDFREGSEWEKKVDKFLFSDEYIQYLLKDKDVTFGYYDKPTNIIVCYKKEKIVNVYDLNNKLKLKHQFKNILIGKNSGDKWREGDGKTPIGVYKLKYRLNDENLSDFYGPLAYPTNYPNLYDSYLGKSGHGIWIHGFPKNNPNRKFNTKGCIAIPNNELLNLSKMIDYRNAILIIDTDKLPTTNKNKIKIILKELFKWRFAWKYNDLETYLSFYDKKHFKKENRYRYRFFAYMKRKIFQKQKRKKLKFKNIQIIPYPSQNKDIYKISFYEIFKTKKHSFEGEKVLYIKLIDNKIKIFLEN